MRCRSHWPSQALALILAVASVGAGSPVAAFKLDTHRALNDRAATISGVNQSGYLQQELALAGGLTTLVTSKSVLEWIRIGGAAEDEYFDGEVLGALNRSGNHFQNPLKPWDQAGLVGRCFGLVVFDPTTTQASVRWAQSSAEQAGRSASWGDARQLFSMALTEAAKKDRDTAMAGLFRVLGQQMHLVADLAVPAHTRNDVHCTPRAEPFEVWAVGGPALNMIQTLTPIAPDRGIFGFNVPIPGEPIAKVPVARLWDTEQYRSTQNPTVTTNGPDAPNPIIGLAEYTNANFLSKHTVFSPAFPFPVASSLTLGPPEVAPNIAPVQLRRYFRKDADGQRVSSIALPSALYDSLADALKDRKIGFDDKVHQAYANHLLPRAVGYSAALLDYFFRGRLEPVFTANPAAPASSLMKVVNRSDEPLGGGTLSVHVDDASGVRSKVGEASIGATPPGLTSEAGVVVDASLEGVAMTVVYQGALGGEANAVIGKAQGSAAVEQIFRGVSDWMLRTATGIFPLGLGLPPTGPVVVKWGDVDNTIVTQDFSGVLDMRFQAYRINRAEGSRTVPLAASPLTAAGAVDLIPLGNPVTLGPTPIDLGTTWNDRRVVDYEQFIVDLVSDSNDAISLLGMETGYATQLNSSRSLRLMMPLDDQSPDYDWTLQDFALNRAGEVVGLVYVTIGTPPSVPVPVRRHRVDGAIADVPGVFEFVDFYTDLRDHCWFIVNLSRRSVLGKTCGDAADTVVTSFAKRSGRLFFDLQTTSGWAPLLEVAPREDARVVGDVSTTFGVTSVGRVSVYRPEWAAQGYGAVQLGSVVSSGLVGVAGVAVRGITTINEVTVVTVLGEMQRSDGPAEGYTVLAAEGRFLEETESVQGWQWRPLTGGLIPLAALSVPAPLGVFVTTHLVDANRTAGMFLTNIFTSPRQRQTRLVSPARELVFSGALQSQYDLLEPGLLYGLTDLRFHRQTQALEGLASPDLLAVGGPTAGAYHVVGRR
jgi:hypothetical protein